MNYSLNRLYRVMGITKQAVHRYAKNQKAFDGAFLALWAEVDMLREEHPGCGLEKIYDSLKPSIMGRDRFCEAFMELGYRVKHPKNFVRTTTPTHIKYPNLIEGLCLSAPNQVWQSDITYFFLKGTFYYITFIIDVYSRKIVGYNLSDSLRATSNIKALRTALKTRNAPQIHHSDRGSQYVSDTYRQLLSKEGTLISMGMQAQDNAYAERINGIIKNEYLKKWDIKTPGELKTKLKKAVNHYNKKRIHTSLPSKQSPNSFEETIQNWDMLEVIYTSKRPPNTKGEFLWTEDCSNKIVCPIFN